MENENEAKIAAQNAELNNNSESTEQENLTEFLDSPREARVYDQEEGIMEIVDSLEEAYEQKDEENRAKFIERLENFREDEVKIIDFAYDLSKEAHRKQVRDSGERYFEHLRSVALILIDECKIKDTNMIVAALLHDSVEDSGMFANRHKYPYSQWKQVASFRLSKVFGPEVAEMVIDLTKPQEDGVELIDEQAAHDFYIENLEKALSKVVLVKMADRLHNLRTLGGTKPEKQKRKIAETREIYLPLFQRVLEDFPEEARYMLDEMEKAMQLLE